MPKILWLSPYSLHDTSSGASIHAKDMFENLVKRGWEAWSCSSFVFDSPNGTTVFGDLEKKLKEDQHKTFILDDNGIHYVYTRCQNRHEMQFSLEEGQLLYETFLDVLDEFKPDIVFGYCPGMTSLTCFAEAKRRGIGTVYLLLNGNHSHFSFPNFDLVVTDSKATSKYYAERDGINVVPTSAFFNPSRFTCEDRTQETAKYVTFINPSPTKGLPIFLKLAKACQSELPDVRFLVINSRANLPEIMGQCHVKGGDEKPFKAMSEFPNVDMAPAQKDMRPVYKVTKVLLAPSLWYESWGRVTSEAIFNNIPVLASQSGGIPEAMGFVGGINIEAPQHCQDDHLSLPDDEEIKPWVEALKRLLNEDWSEQLKKAQESLSTDTSTSRAIETLMPLVLQCASDSPMFYRK